MRQALSTVTECTVVTVNTVVNLEARIMAGTRDKYVFQRPSPNDALRPAGTHLLKAVQFPQHDTLVLRAANKPSANEPVKDAMASNYNQLICLMVPGLPSQMCGDMTPH